MSEPRFCSRCGASLAAGAGFCQSCGQAVVVAAPAQRAAAPAQWTPSVPPAQAPPPAQWQSPPVAYPPAPPQQAWMAPPPVRQEPFSWAGVLSLVLGMLSLIPSLGIFSWFVLLAALILGIVGLFRRRGRGWAIAGVIFCVLVIILYFIGLASLM